MSVLFAELWAKATVPGGSRPAPGKAERKPKAQRYTRQAEEEDIRGDVEEILIPLDPEDATLIGGVPPEWVKQGIELLEDQSSSIFEVLELTTLEPVLYALIQASQSEDDHAVALQELSARESMTPEAWAIR